MNYTRKKGPKSYDKEPRFWHDELEELTVRIDVHPDDIKKFDEKWTRKLEHMSPPNYPITKASGGVLELVDEESYIPRSWGGLNQEGKHVEWRSMTMVWRVN